MPRLLPSRLLSCRAPSREQRETNEFPTLKPCHLFNVSLGMCRVYQSLLTHINHEAHGDPLWLPGFIDTAKAHGDAQPLGSG